VCNLGDAVFGEESDELTVVTYVPCDAEIPPSFASFKAKVDRLFSHASQALA
jgi:hypothetical protein